MRDRRLFFLIIFGLVAGGCMVNKQSSRQESSVLKFSENVEISYLGKVTRILPTVIPSSIESCSVSPNLPEGLSLTNSCEVIGVASTVSALNLYQISVVTKNGTFNAELWMQVIKDGQRFSGFSYPASTFNLTGPGAIPTIIPILNEGLPETCFAVPSLPNNLVLNPSDCRITGFVNSTKPPQTYTVYARSSDGSEYSNSITIQQSVSLGVTTGLMAHYDARLASGFGPLSGCSNSLANWKDLSANNFPFRLVGTGGNKTPSCPDGSGWFGNGTKTEPYRWRSSKTNSTSEYKSLTYLPRMDDGYNSPGQGNWTDAVSISFWARTMSDDFRFFAVERDSSPDGGSNILFPYSLSSAGVGLDLRTGLENGPLNSVISSWRPPKYEWHHYTFVSDTYNRVYIDGALIKHNAMKFHRLANYGGSLQSYYMFGSRGTTEFAQIKMFDRTLSDAEVLLECENLRDILDGADCRSGLRSSRIKDFKSPTGYCYRNDFTLVDLNNTALAPSEDTQFRFQADSGFRVYSDVGCTNDITDSEITYTTAMTTFPLYFKSSQTGTKSLTISAIPNQSTGRAVVPPRIITATYSNPATQIKLYVSSNSLFNSTLVTPGTFLLPHASNYYLFSVSLVDADGNPAFSETDRVVTLSETGANPITAVNAMTATITAETTSTNLKRTSDSNEHYSLANKPNSAVVIATAGLPDFTTTLNQPVADRITMTAGYDCIAPYLYFKPTFSNDTTLAYSNQAWIYDIYRQDTMAFVDTATISANSYDISRINVLPQTTYIIKDQATDTVVKTLTTPAAEEVYCGGGGD